MTDPAPDPLSRITTIALTLERLIIELDHLYDDVAGYSADDK